MRPDSRPNAWGAVTLLYSVGCGASRGGLVVAMVGSRKGKGEETTLIKDARASGQVVQVVHAQTEGATCFVHRIADPAPRPTGRPGVGRVASAGSPGNCSTFPGVERRRGPQ